MHSPTLTAPKPIYDGYERQVKRDPLSITTNLYLFLVQLCDRASTHSRDQCTSVTEVEMCPVNVPPVVFVNFAVIYVDGVQTSDYEVSGTCGRP